MHIQVIFIHHCLFCFCFLFVCFLTLQIKVKSQLRVSGIGMWEFWASHFLVDVIQFLLPFIMGIIIVVAFQMDSFMQAGALFMFIIFMLMYIPLTTLVCYCASFAFDDYETASGILQVIILYVSTISIDGVTSSLF